MVLCCNKPSQDNFLLFDNFYEYESIFSPPKACNNERNLKKKNFVRLSLKCGNQWWCLMRHMHACDSVIDVTIFGLEFDKCFLFCTFLISKCWRHSKLRIFPCKSSKCVEILFIYSLGSLSIISSKNEILFCISFQRHFKLML